MIGTRVPLQGGEQCRHVAHGLVDAIAVLQGGTVAVKLLGQAVQVREAPQQVVLARLPELSVTHKALHQVQPGQTDGWRDRQPERSCLFITVFSFFFGKSTIAICRRFY